MTSVVVSLCFAISAFLAILVSAIPFAATAPALVVVGIMMMSAFREIQWDDFDEAVPAYFAGVFMAICYSISYGIAAGFIFYCITKICKKQAKQIHPTSGLRPSCLSSTLSCWPSSNPARQEKIGPSSPASAAGRAGLFLP